MLLAMRKVTSPIINRDYWIGLDDSPDGSPVFTHAEVELLKANKDTLPADLLNKIFDVKSVLKVSLFELDFNNLPSTERTRGLEICGETIQMLMKAKSSSSSGPLK